MFLVDVGMISTSIEGCGVKLLVCGKSFRFYVPVFVRLSVRIDAYGYVLNLVAFFVIHIHNFENGCCKVAE